MVRELAGEVLVYDHRTHRAHCLNPVASQVFLRCDGRTSAGGIARAIRGELGLAVGESSVRLALEQLDEAGLLRTALGAVAPAERESRRELLKKAALGTAVLLPAVVSILVPTPAEAAATCVSDCTGKPFGTPCSSTAPSNCFCTCDGSGGCAGGC